MRQREYAMPVVARQAPLGEVAPPLVPPRLTAARAVTIAALVESQHGPLAATTGKQVTPQLARATSGDHIQHARDLGKLLVRISLLRQFGLPAISRQHMRHLQLGRVFQQPACIQMHEPCIVSLTR